MSQSLVYRVLRLSWREPRRALLVSRMAGWVIILSGLVKLGSLSRALRLISPSPRVNRNRDGYQPEDLSTAIDAVLEMNFLMFKPSCWKRATVLHRYLALQGIPTSIVFGVLKDPAGELKGHAWLERESQPLLEPPGPAYKVTYRFPSQESAEIPLQIMDAS